MKIPPLKNDDSGVTRCTFWDCELPCETVDECYILHTADDLRTGDASFHTGTTFHYSGANTSPHARPALALAFIESGAQIKSEKDLHEGMLQNDRQSWERWLDGSDKAQPGGHVDSPFVPVTYIKAGTTTRSKGTYTYDFLIVLHTCQDRFGPHFWVTF